ncbi:MAG: Ig-like domain repeat protein [Euryarchaeota archaeon]
MEGPPANATNATLTLSNCSTVNWGQQGREKSDLSNCPPGYKGYWHFVYTPAGILALSSANCVKVEGTPTSLIADNVRVCPKTDITLRARLTENVEGTPLEGKTITFCWVTNVDINNPQTMCANATTDEDGWAEYVIVGGLPKCPFSGPDECRYNVLAWFAGDEIYEYSQTDFNILVRQFDTEIAVLNVAGNQGDEVILSATLTKEEDSSPIAGKTLNFYVNGVYVGSALTNAQGVATLAYTITQTQGKYTITAEFETEGCFRGAEGEGELDVEFNGVVLTVDGVTICPLGKPIVTAKLTDLEGNPLPGRTIKFSINPETEGVTNAQGIALGIFDPLPLGTYNVNALFEGDGEFEAATVNSTLNVTPDEFPTILTLDNVQGNQGQSVLLKATLTDDDGIPLEGKTIDFYVDDTLVGSAITNSEGLATLEYIITQTKGQYTTKAVFEGYECYLASTDYANLDVEFSTALITVENVTICPLGKPIVTAKLTDLEGNPLPGRTIKFSINPETEGVTNAQGIALGIFDPLPLGTYNVNALFEGDSEYAAVDANSTLNVTPDEFPTILTLNNVKGSKGDQVTLRATLTDEDGIPLPGQNIDFYVNGVYVGSALTNAAGVATLLYTITQNAGTYTISAVFGGFECYQASSAEATLEVLSSAHAGTVPMQETGTPLAPLLAGILAVLAGAFWKKK